MKKSLAAIKIPDLGCLGSLLGRTFLTESMRRNTAVSEFDIAGIKPLPRVDIIYTYVNDDRMLIDYAVKSGAKGIAGSMGSIHKDAESGLIDARKAGDVVARSTRVGNGMVVAAQNAGPKKHL